MMNKYILTIQQAILTNLGSSDRLTLQFVDECSVSRAERIFSLDLSSMKFSSNRDGLNNKADSACRRLRHFLVDSVQTGFRNTILQSRANRVGCEGFTDIANALKDITSLLSQEKSFFNVKEQVLNDAQGKDNYEYENCIVIFSDMVNESRDKMMDFTQFGKLDKGKVLGRIEELNRSGNIPDLKKCKVLIYGATSTINSGFLANRQIENCKAFWEKYFKESGAEIIGYGFDTKQEITNYLASK